MRKSNSHRRLICTAGILALAGISACAQNTAEYEPEQWSVSVVADYPHDATAWTQGLTVDAGVLYESTGREGTSSIRRVDLATGTVEQSNRLNRQYFGEGFAVVDDRIYMLTWEDELGMVFDKESFRVLDTFNYDGEGWGLTYDGRHLIMSDGSSTIEFRDVEDFSVVRSINVHSGEEAIDALNELEYVDGEIWANIWYEDVIARISPEDGSILGWIDISNVYPSSLRDRNSVANGIAHDADAGKYYVTGKLWPRLYEIEIARP